MVKRIFAALLAILILAGSIACNQASSDGNGTVTEDRISAGTTGTYTEVTTAAETDSDEPKLPQERLYYVIQTDWMTLCFLKRNFTEAEIYPIAEEAIRVMADIRTYLGVSYSIEDARGTYCYFNPSYVNKAGEARSTCYHISKEMYCRSVGDFVHEYAHMVSLCSSDLLYPGNDLFCEGLAQYVGVNFDERIASGKYVYFSGPEEEIPSLEKLAEDERWICERIADLSLPFTEKNFEKAWVAYMDRTTDLSEIDQNSDFYKYYIGMVFVEYCIDNLGGVEKFMEVFSDSVTFSEVYGKPLDGIVADALKYNTEFFDGAHSKKTEILPKAD